MSRKPETTMVGSAGAVELHRLPAEHDPSLRAWDAADEFVLADLADSTDAWANDGQRRWLVVNDLFGALAVSLCARDASSDGTELSVQSWGDSITSHEATARNLERNGHDPSRVAVVPSTQDPVGPIDVAVIKIPRSLALLEDQLRRLRPLLHPDSVVIGAGMVKAIHNSTIELFASIIGPSPTSLAKKKARLIRSTLDDSLDVLEFAADGDGRAAPGEVATYQLASGRPVHEFANVFSRGKLDIGTRAMLDHLPNVAEGQHVLDLGCGNGLLGLHIAEQAPGTGLGSLTFVDESYQAVASAERTAQSWFAESGSAQAWSAEPGLARTGLAKTELAQTGLAQAVRFIVARTLDDLDDGSVDLVVNNPPFHTHQSRSDSIALAMFDDARRLLAPGGRLVVVGNRHLGYHRELGRRFSSVRTVGSTAKFVVLEATNGRS